MKLYNTLTHQLETFTPEDPQNVKIYTCGPTVYDFAHLGNFTAYIYWDLLTRTLQAHSFKVNRILNLTDVGHLTSDQDDGEDKLEKGARREGKTVWEIADFYADDFLKNYQLLNLLPPTKLCRATDYIQQGTKLVDTLTEKGYTYETSDGVYFDTSKFKTYQDFARLDLDHLKAGARVAYSSEKRNVSDFALWKFIKDGEDHAMRWDYLGRPGYPGWHLECSSIIHSELGEPIDIHAGGIDHIPVHHTNEIAQSEAAFDHALARFWLHCNFILVDGTKISKSIGNVYYLKDLEKEGYDPLDFKLWVLEGHYQATDRNFSFSALDAAKTRRLRWRNRIAEELQHPSGTDLKTDILKAVDNDLHSGDAFAIIDGNTPDLKTWKFIDDLFGLNLVPSVKSLDIKSFIESVHKRETARNLRDYATADKIRADLSKQGITIKDTPHGPIWQFTI